jgi:hypothetical protein
MKSDIGPIASEELAAIDAIVEAMVAKPPALFD